MNSIIYFFFHFYFSFFFFFFIFFFLFFSIFFFHFFSFFFLWSSENGTALSPNSKPAKPGFSPVHSPNSEPTEPRFGPVLSPNSEPAESELGPVLSPNSEPARVWEFGERNWLISDLQTCRTRDRPSSCSELRICQGSEFRERNWPFSELRNCRTRVIPILSPNSELKLRTPGKNTILDHLARVRCVT